MSEKIDGLDFFEGFKICSNNERASDEIADCLKRLINDKCLIICIGTDKYIGDCLGPLVGSFLIDDGIECPVIGTLENPVHAINLKASIKNIKMNFPDYRIIAVDACLGSEDCIGSIQIRSGSIYPGKGVGKNLPPIGDLSIVGVVDSAENSSIFPLYNIRLSMVMKMSKIISKGICKAQLGVKIEL